MLVQTTSGSAGAELTLEGLKEFEAIRDFLYSRMRGVRDQGHSPAPVAASGNGAALDSDSGPVAEDPSAVLREVARELRQIRVALEARSADPTGRRPTDV